MSNGYEAVLEILKRGGEAGMLDTLIVPAKQEKYGLKVVIDDVKYELDIRSASDEGDA